MVQLRTAVLLAVTASAVWADEVRLDSGGSLRGEIVEPAGGADRSRVVLATPHGRIEIDRERVRRSRVETPAEAEYRRRAPSVSDTVEAQFALARWCRDNGVGEAMRRHLHRVVVLDPDHKEARVLLGYQRVDGKWMTRDDILAARGMISLDGTFRTRQEAELLERRELAQKTQIAWRKRLARWRSDLTGRNQAEADAAAEAFDTLADTEAAAELVALLRDEKDRRVRVRLTRAAGRLGTPFCLAAMVDIALRDVDPELRAVAVEILAADGRPGLTAPFVKALRSSDNKTINHAGDALSVLGTPATIGPLIDALVTTHKKVVGNQGGGERYSFNSGNGTTSFGGGGPKILSGEIRNPGVLSALTRLTEVNFGYNEAEWRAYLAAQQTDEPVDLRRDS